MLCAQAPMEEIPAFALCETSLDALRVSALVASLDDAGCGALVTFEGRVRNLNEGRKVASLCYEAYPALAHAEASAIFAEARARFGFTAAHCMHRVGELAVGEVAVWIGVVSAHRDVAFEACRFLIDEIKARVPIWKKETYVDASASWVTCLGCAGRSSRHSHAIDFGRRAIVEVTT